MEQNISYSSGWTENAEAIAIGKLVADHCSQLKPNGEPHSPNRYAMIYQSAAMGAHQFSVNHTRATPSADDARDAIFAAVAAEIAKATEKFPTWPTRIIDAGNVVSEEAGELAKACLQVTYEKHKETLEGVRMEAIQTMAMCYRFLASLDRYDLTPGDQHEQPVPESLRALKGTGHD